MKKMYLVFGICMVLMSCSKDCESENSPVCQTAPPTDEACQAYFLNWFYNPNTKSCEQIGYSGCTDVGFKTREDCEICLCN